MSEPESAPPVSEAFGDFEALFDNAPCGYVIADSSGRIIRMNLTLADWLDSEAASFTSRKFSDLLTIAGKIYYETHFAPLLRMQGFFNEVALDLTLAGRKPLPVLVNATERPAEGDGPRFIQITVFKASDRRRYEQELLEARAVAQQASEDLRHLNETLESRVEAEVADRIKAEEALRQAQKMEAVGQLTGGVAHDFNNLLTVILGGLETVSRQLAAGPSPDLNRIERAVGMATHGAERAATLTARLLAFARRQPLEPRPVDAGRLINGLADMLERTLGDHIAFETVGGAGLWLAHVDAGELENALVNLAVNARDAMPGGGHLTIETSNAWLDEAYVAAFVEPVSPGQYVLIAVTDTGEGMDEAVIQKVFEPFFTTKSVGKGTGLGLSQVYGFVRQTGGHIRIYSEPGAGTTVKIYLPRFAGAAEIAQTREARVAADGGSEMILLVEDHEDLRAYSAGVLGELGYTVLEAPDGPTALSVLESNPEIALLFTDVVMPGGLDGRQLADEARRRRPGLKVLFTTGYTRNAIVHNGRLDPGINLLSKPFTFHDLSVAVRRLLDE